MSLVTLIARIPDGLMLAESAAALPPDPPKPDTKKGPSPSSASSATAAASSSSEKFNPDIVSASSIEFHRAQAKQVFKKLSERSPPRLTIEAGPGFYYAYTMHSNVCVLAVCERSYPKKLAFDFCAELLKEFETSHGADVRSASRPYSFISFESFISKTRRLYADTRSQLAIDKVAEELRDAQRVMTQNIQDILDRGEKISSVATKSEQLVSDTSRYQKQARDFERFMWWRQKMPIFVVAGLLLLLLLFRLFIL